MNRLFCCLVLAALWLPVRSNAQTATANLDAAKTHVEWSLEGNVHTTHGTFRLKEGRIGLNFEKKTMSGMVVVDAKSGESGNETRDHRMHAEVLKSDKYPEIRFAPSSWQGDLAMAGSSKIQVSGVLDLYGAKHDVTIPMELKLDQGHFSGSVQFDVPYVQWGMKDPTNFLFKVDKKVSIHVTAEGEYSH